VAVYRGVSAPRNGEGSPVILSRWPDQPIGSVQGWTHGWSAWLEVPDEGLTLIERGLHTKRDAIYTVVAGYHFRFRRGKSWPVMQRPSRAPVKSRWDLLPPGIPWGERNEAMGQLHRFLGVNRRLFDKPDVIRPYTGEPYAADEIEEHIR
jgi:hypothetical protein